ncbi:unnamed protein product [Clavelina lepadiformis]|uniref:Sushi domain-containing protein n=1 Tax=Clavelina lepadiformis TaxID=159417 RepID=A0ABP0G534_CLALP
MIVVTLGMMELEDSPHSPATSTLIESCLPDPVRLVSLSVVTFSKPNRPIGCFPPPPGPNCVFNFDVNNSIIPVKTTVKYECYLGFSATGPTQFSCQDGKWDIELRIPNCTIPEIACLAPPPPLEGAVLLSANEILTKTNFSLRTEVMYGCEDPCSTHVKDTFTCTLSDCNNPPSVAHARNLPLRKEKIHKLDTCVILDIILQILHSSNAFNENG